MNEQLVVKNFGPIKDATVDFKRVTVFIGPTGGGKSTLAKLAAVFRDVRIYTSGQKGTIASMTAYGIDTFLENVSFLNWHGRLMNFRLMEGNWQIGSTQDEIFIQAQELARRMQAAGNDMKAFLSGGREFKTTEAMRQRMNEIKQLDEESYVFFQNTIGPNRPFYFPAERILLSILGATWPNLIGENINLPVTLLEFAKQYLIAREQIENLRLLDFDTDYQHYNGNDTIKLSNGITLPLTKAASGIQSVTPLLVLLEHLSRNTEQAQSFIIEEPELNLYPTAQQGLLNWLVEKCTKGENDLTITTHSPYLLAHFNLLLYAYQVAENHPDRADDVAKIVPRESWINPREFAAYHVEGQQDNGVRSIVNPETGLISYNGLDATANAETSEFEKLLDINAGLEVE